MARISKVPVEGQDGKASLLPRHVIVVRVASFAFRFESVEREISTASPSDLWTCTKCGGPMVVIERFTAAEIQLRSPPPDAVAA